MMGRLDEPLSVERVARGSGLSTRTLHRVIRREYRGVAHGAAATGPPRQGATGPPDAVPGNYGDHGGDALWIQPPGPFLRRVRAAVRRITFGHVASRSGRSRRHPDRARSGCCRRRGAIRQAVHLAGHVPGRPPARKGPVSRTPAGKTSMTHRPVRMTALLAGTGLAMTLAGLLSLQTRSSAQGQGAGAVADPVNFGFPIGFSVEKMDRTADPRKDFVRYAAGKWIDAAVIPADSVRVSSIDLLARQVERQIGAILAEAGKPAPPPPRGRRGSRWATSTRRAWTSRPHASWVSRRSRRRWTRLPSTRPRRWPPRSPACLQILNEPVLAAVLVGTDPNDRTRYAVYVADGELPMGTDNYLKPEAAPVRDGLPRDGGRQARDRGLREGRGGAHRREGARDRDPRRAQEADAR